MSFQAMKFLYDGVAGETYNLFLAENSYNPVQSNTGGSDIQLQTQTVYRRSSPYLFGVTQNTVLEFDFTFLCLDYSVDRMMISSIQRNFFGKVGGYKELQILQCDMYSVFYRCKLTSVEVIEVANYPYGFKVHAICDAPWAWESEKTTTLTTTGNTTTTFYNDSDDDDYLYPTLTFKLPTNVTNFKVVNVTDNNRETTFTSLSSSETITMDNSRQILTSSLGLYRMTNFNKNWFRLLPGNNVLTFTYTLSSCSITYNFARKIGGV